MADVLPETGGSLFTPADHRFFRLGDHPKHAELTGDDTVIQYRIPVRDVGGQKIPPFLKFFSEPNLLVEKQF